MFEHRHGETQTWWTVEHRADPAAMTVYKKCALPVVNQFGMTGAFF